MQHLTPTPSTPINRDWIIGAFALLLLFYPETKTRNRTASNSTNLSGVGSPTSRKKKESGMGTASKRLKGNRLYYLWEEPGHEPKSRSKKDVAKLKQRAQRGSGRLYTVYARSANDARQEIKKGRAEIYSMFGGTTANCGIWDIAFSNKLNKYVWRCMMYGPACDGRDCITPATKKLTGLAGALRTCVSYKTIQTIHGKAKRCAKYGPTCTTSACLPERMPKPSDVMPFQPSKADVRGYARSLAEEENRRQAEAGPWLSREIMSRGGIRAYRGQVETEEWKEIPLHLKRKTGLPLDEMASEMGLDEAGLVTAIYREYPKTQKKKRRFRWQDFEQQAYETMFTQGNPQLGQATFITRDPRGETPGLFPGMKRVLVLETQDPAVSDDPLAIHLERRGWDMRRVRELQESIAEKMTPDMFTGKMTPLSPAEKELQKEIDAFMPKAYREPVTEPVILYEPTQQTMFRPTPAQTRMFGDMPNFHAARVRSERGFKRLRTIHLSPGVSALVGPLKKGKTTGSRVQTYRFDRDFFTAAQAKSWLRKYDIKPILFEPARRLSGLAGDLMNCAEWQDVYSKFYKKDVVRCARYAPTCNAPDCIEQPAKRNGKKPPVKKLTAKKLPKRVEPIPPPLTPIKLTDEEAAIMRSLAKGTLHIDEVGRAAKLPPYKTSAGLVMLEMKGMVQQKSGKMFEAKVAIKKMAKPPPKAKAKPSPAPTVSRINLTPDEVEIYGKLLSETTNQITKIDLMERTGMSAARLEKARKRLVSANLIVGIDNHRLILRSGTDKITAGRWLSARKAELLKKKVKKKVSKTIPPPGVVDLTDDQAAILRAFRGRASGTLTKYQMQEKTGMSRPRIDKALKWLRIINVVGSISEGTYLINVDIDEYLSPAQGREKRKGLAKTELIPAERYMLKTMAGQSVSPGVYAHETYGANPSPLWSYENYVKDMMENLERKGFVKSTGTGLYRKYKQTSKPMDQA